MTSTDLPVRTPSTARAPRPVREVPALTAPALPAVAWLLALMTLPVGITSVKDAYGIQYAQTMASAVPAALPLVVVFMIFQRHIVKSVATAGLGGQ